MESVEHGAKKEIGCGMRRRFLHEEQKRNRKVSGVTCLDLDLVSLGCCVVMTGDLAPDPAGQADGGGVPR